MGGNSREREVSFAGGRTVIDNLDQSLFEAVPLFIDSFGEAVFINWKWIYKGSIRDFYPDSSYYPSQAQAGASTFYAEQIGPYSPSLAAEWRSQLGKSVRWDELHEHIDIAFLALHGKNGEDGRIQGLLEYHGIPYTGSGVGASALGMNKLAQRRIMKQMGLPVPAFCSIDRQSWIARNQQERTDLYTEWSVALGFPMVIKPANQGSSIGMSILNPANQGNSNGMSTLNVDDLDSFTSAIDRAFFRGVVKGSDWLRLTDQQKINQANEWSDPKSGIGLPARGIDGHIMYHALELIDWLNENLKNDSDTVCFDSLDDESVVLGESFLTGDEFSCIVIESETGQPIALPPTGIRKSSLLYDYRAKYLPGQARKTTPIELPENQIRRIQKACEELYILLGFAVYARIDGFINPDGTVYLNDPNTTSGMMPSSFFFHQAAEVGMNPSQFLTYIVFTSLRRIARPWEFEQSLPETTKAASPDKKSRSTFGKLQLLLHSSKNNAGEKTPIAVIMGGSSSERHISVESGRNVFEKLSSSGIFDPISLFLTGSDAHFRLFEIPINLHLKDHADDIAGKLEHYTEHPIVVETRERCAKITALLGCRPVVAPKEINLTQLAGRVRQVFIALHGRPGEDGTLQRALEEVGLSYNGSGPESSALTIDKYRTNRLLAEHGIKVAAARLVNLSDVYSAGGYEALAARIIHEMPLPLIAKPVDDGCSSGVVRIDHIDQLVAYLSTNLVSRADKNMPPQAIESLDRILIEECIEQGTADRFLEVTGGMLIHTPDEGLPTYEVFEPSESLAGKGILSLEEKFLAGEGQNITPARFSANPVERNQISHQVKSVFEQVARILDVRGYCRIDAFVRIFEQSTGPKVEVLIIELNSLPGMTPATCIFHQCALQGYKPDEFIRQILAEGRNRNATGDISRNAAEGISRNAAEGISRKAAEGISRKAAGGISRNANEARL
jgi:D-alanine-D-alanine ligase